jgi:glycosyltransferase involved in cell wall biosynthesis
VSGTVTETLTQSIPKASRIDTAVPARAFEEPVRVVYFVPQLTVGGTEVQLTELLLRLKRNLFRPAVWCSGPWGPLGDSLKENGVPIVRFHLSPRRPLAFVRTVRWLRHMRPTIFHSFGYGDHWLDVLAAKCAGIPCCITCRRNVRHWDPKRRLRWSERLRNLWTDQVVANCAAAAEVCTEVEGIPREKIQVIYNGIEVRETKRELELRRSLGIGATALLVGNVANLKRIKGQDILIRAFRRVADEMPQTRLAIWGEGEEGSSLKRLSQELGLSTQVFFLGLGHDLKPLYGSLDLYVHSSRAEGFSNSILEAMAYGVPVVATAAGGTAELFGEDGRDALVPPENVSALARAMLRMLKDETLRVRHGSAGRNNVAGKFTFARTVAAHEALYLKLLHDTAEARTCAAETTGI